MRMNKSQFSSDFGAKEAAKSPLALHNDNDVILETAMTRKKFHLSRSCSKFEIEGISIISPNLFREKEKTINFMDFMTDPAEKRNFF